MKESSDPFTAESAIEVLLDKANRMLKVYPEKDGFILFEDRVEVFWNLLEKIIDYQVNMVGACGELLDRQPRRDLKGWDFRDMATLRDPLFPRSAELNADGRCWVDFIRSIQAVTLFGRGFGEIIQPDTKDLCEKWTKLPKDKFYLAASVSDLESILDTDFCEATISPTRLSEMAICYNPSRKGTECRCGWGSCDPVHVLLPVAYSDKVPQEDITMRFTKRGAVIFGQNSTMPWVWGDTGPPGDEGDLFACLPTDQDSRRSGALKPINDFFTPHADIYTVGILCALPKELRAILMVFDDIYKSPTMIDDDPRHYAYGRIGQHHVVATCLPTGEYGTNSAANSAANMKRSFRSVRFCLLVGIGGGVPSAQNDIRLGDVVVGVPTGRLPGIVQYDMGKSVKGGEFQITGSLDRPPRRLTTAISSLRADTSLPAFPLTSLLEGMAAINPEYEHPGQIHDQLFSNSCSKCAVGDSCPGATTHVTSRALRPQDHPEIHYGTIASGNRVIKDAHERDSLAKADDILCFEMEAAGVVNTIRCLVIRGICDYADCRKNKRWQEYASATAAAYTKLLLRYVEAE